MNLSTVLLAAAVITLVVALADLYRSALRGELSLFGIIGAALAIGFVITAAVVDPTTEVPAIDWADWAFGS